MKPEILLVEPMMASIETALDRDYTVHRLPPPGEGRDRLLAEIAPRLRVIVTGGSTGASRALMDALPALALVAINGVGTDAVDLVEARRRGIRVTNTPDVLTDDVADLAMGLIVATLRRLAEADRFVRAGRWGPERMGLARKVTGKRLGIFGLGRIGRAVARRAAGFSMPLAYTSRTPVEGVDGRFVADLEELARDSDVLVLTAAATAETRGIVGRRVLDALGPDGVLINVARGALVDEAELVAALREGRLGGAGLDVFADEPRVPPALFDLDTVVLVPHQASATLETRTAMGDLVLANVAAFLDGDALLTPVV